MSEEAARILVISADAAVQETIARIASVLGHEISRAASGLEAVERARQQGFDLLVADRRLSDLEGLSTPSPEADARPSPPVVLISNEEIEADECLSLPLQEREVRRSLRRSLERRRQQQQSERLLQQQWRDAAQLLKLLAARVEAADPYFKGHAQRVAELSGRIGRHLKLPRKGLEILDLAAHLHDVGTLDEKLDAVRQADALPLQEVFRIIVHHHEWFDGSGRPSGLKGELIPLEARILCVAEAYDAMVSPRPYRDRLSRPQALEILRQEAGSHFDPDVVGAFEHVLDETASPAPTSPTVAPAEKRRVGLLLSLAHTYLQNGNLDVALKAYEDCLDVIGQTRVATRAEAWNGVAMIHLQRGYMGAARTALAEALSASQGVSDLQAARSQCLEALMDAQQGRLQDAEQALAQASEVFEGWESRPDLARVHLLGALIHQNDDAVCRQRLLDALAYLGEHDLGEVPVRERALFAPLFLKAFAAGWQDDAVAPFLLRFGPGGLAPWLSGIPAAAAARVKALLNSGGTTAPDDVTIYCFGRFRVFCGGREVADDAWKTRKSRYLFAYLALQEGDREVSDDRLLELFWPDHEREKARQSLYAALSHVRRALETALPEGQKVVLAHKGSYRINPDLRSRVDVLEFERHYATGREALRQDRLAEAIDAFQRAETLYGGDLLEGNDSEWALRLRDETERHYQEILTRLMDHFADKQRMQVVADYAQRLLSMDPCQQVAHSHLMRAYVALGRPELAVRQYHLCCQIMKDELNLSPSAELSNLYLSLRR